MDHEKIEQAAGSDREPDAPQRQVASRRRFLKGTSLALPAVMTLHSVSAQAQARVSLTCADTQPTYTGQVLTPTQTDEVFRKAVPVYGGKTASGSPPSVTYTPENPAEPRYFRGLKAGTPPTDVYRKVEDGSVVTDENLVNLDEAFASQYAVVHFDKNTGAVISIGEPVPDGNAMVTSLTGACLHSLWGQTV